MRFWILLNAAVMSICAIIPARGGSKGVPGKNIRLLAGKPLLCWTVEHAARSSRIDRVIVSTDDDAIATTAVSQGAEVVRRPFDISGDRASSESALLHALDALREREGYEPALVVFMQCTSPLRGRRDLDDAIERFLKEDADSLLAVVPIQKFFWHKTEDGPAALNYEYAARPPHGDLPVYYHETGSFYIMRPALLRETGLRLGGKIVMYAMAGETAVDIDTEEDFLLAEQAMHAWQRRSRDAGGFVDDH